jgi:glycosyltransferase involved in cell wall biosynthesis
MRVALISEHASPLAVFGGEDAGGQNTHVADLSAALADRGHDVRIYTRRDARRLPAEVRVSDGVTVVHVPAGPAKTLPKDALLPYMGGFGRWLGRQWRDGLWAPDVIHAHFWMSGLAALTAAHDHPAPIVQTYHALGTVKRRYQGAADTSPPERIGLERVLGRSVDRVIAQCQDEIDELLRLGVPRARIVLVPSGVNLDKFTAHGPAVPRPAGRFRVLSIGRLVERKGFADVIAAMRYVHNADLVIVGGSTDPDDPQAHRLLEHAVDHGVAGRVQLVGAVPPDRVAQWYRSADVLVAAPWYEPFGLTPLEAMACGVPVVATAVGGLLDTVVDGITGRLVPPRDPRALGDAVRTLLNDAIVRRSYASAALDRARSCYSWPRAATQLETVYADVLQQSHTSEVLTG